jgi:hypothetical protein
MTVCSLTVLPFAGAFWGAASAGRGYGGVRCERRGHD